MTETLRERTGPVPITLGLGADDLEGQPRLTLLPASRYLDYLSIHVYPCRLLWAAGPLDAGPLPFLGCIAYWLTKKPVLLQEFGVPTAPILRQGQGSEEPLKDPSLVDEEDGARFAEESLRLARRFELIGAFWGAYGDYHPTVWSWPPLDRYSSERFLGLIRYDGSPKPAVGAFRSGGTKEGKTAPITEWLDVEKGEFLQDPTMHLPRLYRRFCDVHGL
jgi:hypothetical protein